MSRGGREGADEGIVCPAYEGQLDRWSRCPDEGLLHSSPLPDARQLSLGARVGQVHICSHTSTRYAPGLKIAPAPQSPSTHPSLVLCNWRYWAESASSHQGS